MNRHLDNMIVIHCRGDNDATTIDRVIFNVFGDMSLFAFTRYYFASSLLSIPSALLLLQNLNSGNLHEISPRSELIWREPTTISHSNAPKSELTIWRGP